MQSLKQFIDIVIKTFCCKYCVENIALTTLCSKHIVLKTMHWKHCDKNIVLKNSLKHILLNILTLYEINSQSFEDENKIFCIDFLSSLFLLFLLSKNVDKNQKVCAVKIPEWFQSIFNVCKWKATWPNWFLMLTLPSSYCWLTSSSSSPMSFSGSLGHTLTCCTQHRASTVSKISISQSWEIITTILIFSNYD